MPAFGGSTNGLVAKHGTQSGYVTHRRHSIPREVCGGACWAAHAAHERTQRVQRRRRAEMLAETGGQDG